VYSVRWKRKFRQVLMCFRRVLLASSAGDVARTLSEASILTDDAGMVTFTHVCTGIASCFGKQNEMTMNTMATRLVRL